MNRLSRIATAGACLLMCGTLSAGEIDQGLEEVFELSEPGEVISTLVYLWEQADIQALKAQHDAERTPFAQRNEEVVQALRETAELTQGALLEELALRRAAGEVETFEPFWIANIVRVDATEPVLRELAQHPDVMLIYWNMPIGTIARGTALRAGGGGAGGRPGGRPDRGDEAVQRDQDRRGRPCRPRSGRKRHAGQAAAAAHRDRADLAHPRLSRRSNRWPRTQ
jgi:hypothetical protein